MRSATPRAWRSCAVLAADGERQCGTFDLGLTKADALASLQGAARGGLTYTRLEGTARFVTLRRDEIDGRFPGLLDAVTRV